jgi:threonine dehydrogenase-like Zn-dependent dehydrogenase
VNHVAVQLVAADRLELNRSKPTPRPGPTQILARVECVGLCYSDVKLLHQFQNHPRKLPVRRHLDAAALAGISSYVPSERPTVPGHEALLRVIEAGDAVTSVQPGRRYLIQADFRDLRTTDSNGAFGYNFEGALQQYVLLDERVTIAANGEHYLVPAPDGRSASQLALIEPWACVEAALRTVERRSLTRGGTLLLAGDARYDLRGLDLTAAATLLYAGDGAVPAGFTPVEPATLAERSVDDLLYAGHDPALLERLFPVVANDGLMLVATAGGSFGRPLSIPIGRVHYGNLRLATTSGAGFADALTAIPAGGEPRTGDHVNVVGAGGPMGVMAMVRAIAGAREGSLVEGGVRGAARAAALRNRITAMAGSRGVRVRLYDGDTERPDGTVDYCLLMAAVPDLVRRAVEEAAPGGIVNLFAGIPADTPVVVDLDQVVAKRVYFIGTSGSTVADMRVVLARIEAGQLDPNLSVGAVAGLAGAVDGLDAVRRRAIAGKVVIYPQLDDVPLLDLDAVAARFPTVRPLLRDGCWTAGAEEEFLRVVGAPTG